MHGISGLLARSALPAPAAFRAFLDDQRAHTAARHARFAELQDQIHDEARKAGIGLVALKGAALHASKVYAPGERPMADLDLYAPAPDADAAASIFARLGFRETPSTWKHRSFEPAEGSGCSRLGEHVSNSLKIELHTHLTERLPHEGIDIAPILFSAALEPGLQCYPSLHTFMAHLLQHAAGALVFRSIRLIHLNDIAIVARQMSRGDWETMLESIAGGPGLWWAYPPLIVTSRYFDAIPADVIETARRSCHWPLRLAARHQTITDLSLSNARISVLPGIAWARTAGEACTHVRNRLLPSAEQKAMRRLQARSVPASGDIAWARQTQARRALRLLFGSPGRPETLAAVHAALEEGAVV
jgi:hypothetical protein